MKKILIRIPAIVIALTIFILSSKSSLPLPQTIKHVDKVAHFIAFFSLAIALSLWFSFTKWETEPVKTALIVVFCTSAYGAIDEIHQKYVPFRVPSVSDWIADTIGAVCAVIVFAIIVKKYKDLFCRKNHS